MRALILLIAFSCKKFFNSLADLEQNIYVYTRREQHKIRLKLIRNSVRLDATEDKTRFIRACVEEPSLSATENGMGVSALGF